MSWLQLEIRTHRDELPQIEAAVLAAGAVAVSLVDAQGEDSAWPVLEPRPGETPIWNDLLLQVLLPIDLDLAPLRHQLMSLDRTLGERIEFSFVAEQDWVAATAHHAVDEVFAGRLRLRPPPVQPQPPSGPVSLYLRPGLAFGSGHHPTTRLCLSWLAAHLAPGQRVLDFGCGSGVLGIAAALLGCDVVAVDYDEQACMATKDNALSNAVAEQVQVFDLQQWQTEDYNQTFDVVVANILAAPLVSLADTFERSVAAEGRIILSGVLAEQTEMVMKAYQQTQFDPPSIEQGWACLVGRSV